MFILIKTEQSDLEAFVSVKPSDDILQELFLQWHHDLATFTSVIDQDMKVLQEREGLDTDRS